MASWVGSLQSHFHFASGVRWAFLSQLFFRSAKFISIPRITPWQMWSQFLCAPWEKFCMLIWHCGSLPSCEKWPELKWIRWELSTLDIENAPIQNCFLVNKAFSPPLLLLLCHKCKPELSIFFAVHCDFALFASKWMHTDIFLYKGKTNLDSAIHWLAYSPNWPIAKSLLTTRLNIIVKNYISLEASCNQ